MSNVFSTIGVFFGVILKFCYSLIGNFGWAIWLFTVLTKILLLPISIMVQVNSIKMVKMYPEMNRYKAKYYGDKDMISEAQYELYKKEKYHPILDLIPVVIQLVLLMGVVEGIRSLMNEGISMIWFNLDLSVVPINTGGNSYIVPILAALSAFAMCFTQNISNVLQSEQSKLNKYTTLTLSVGLSLILGLFVPAGIGIYWTASNILSIALMYILNFFINPKKHIDYVALEESQKELEKVNKSKEEQTKHRSKEEIEKEKIDYKRFLKEGSKQIVFYSEGKGFYKYFKDVIQDILARTDIEIHYITSDINDEVFALTSDQFKVYYIGENKLIVLMMKMDADIVVMTMPDLQKYHIKRSIIRDDIEYVYMDHGIGSVNMLLRKHALDYFDTVFATNDFDVREIKGQEQKYDLKPKKIVNVGFSLIDNMINAYDETADEKHTKTQILIAPSWQDDNIIDSCVEDILDTILGKGYSVVVRPHPQYVRHNPSRLNEIKEKYASYEDFELQTDFSSNKMVYDADILMTDWSGIAYEYSLTTLKPTLFINTPMKIMNPDYEEINVVPLDLEIRDRIGISVEPNKCDTLNDVINRLLNDKAYSKEEIKMMRTEYLFNVGHSARVGADYLINSLIEKYKKMK